MRKTLIDFFNEKFEANMVGRKLIDAFNKTNEDLGFQAYSDYNSYSVCKKRAKKLKNKNRGFV
jgi:hypothetical protein